VLLESPGFFVGVVIAKTQAVGHLIDVSEGLREGDLETVSKGKVKVRLIPLPSSG
jgi:hypothetical protein